MFSRGLEFCIKCFLEAAKMSEMQKIGQLIRYAIT